jgi:iron complex outermembrane receptor protein
VRFFRELALQIVTRVPVLAVHGNLECAVNPLHKLGFLPVALAATAGFSPVLAPNTSGQQQTAVVERVIVTGSAIPTAEEIGTNPVFSINRDLINKSGAGTTAEQLLQRLPVMNGATIPVQNNATGGAGPAGTAALALRGLDPGATLVLIDHRRVAPFPGLRQLRVRFR